MLFIFLFSLLLLSLVPQSLYSKDDTEPEEESIIVYGGVFPITGGFSIWDQIIYADKWSTPTFGGLYSFEAQEDLQITPILAESMPEVDIDEGTGTMDVTVTLKADAKFYDGEPITADDVVFTYKMVLSPAVSLAGQLYNKFRGAFSSNDSISKIDTHTVKFHFNTITAFYMIYLNWLVLPKSVFEPNYIAGIYDNYTDSSGKYLNSAGPYIVEEIDLENSTVLFTKNPYWGGNPVKTDKIFYKYYNCTESNTQLVSDFKNGKIDVIGHEGFLFHYNYVFRENFADMEGIVQEFPTSGGNHQLPLNHANGYINGSLTPNGLAAGTNPEQYKEYGKYVRKAISHIIDRETIVIDIYNNLASESHSIVPPFCLGYDNTLDPRSFSIETAKNYLEMAGFDYADLGGRDFDPEQILKENCFFDLWMIVGDTTSEKIEFMGMIRDELASIGIYANLTVLDIWDYYFLFYFRSEPTLPGTVNNDTYIGGFDICTFGIPSFPIFDPSFCFEDWATPPYGMNMYNYNESSYEEVLLKYTTEMDQIKFVDAFKEWQAYMYEWEPTIPIFDTLSYFVHLDNVTGIHPELHAMGMPNWEDWAGARTIPVETESSNMSWVISITAILIIPALLQKKKKKEVKK